MPRMATEDNSYLHEVDGLCLAERHEKMAREGEFQGLWEYLLDNEWGMIDQPECFRLLLQAVEVAARNDARKFSADIFAKVLAFTSYLLLRTHFQLSSLLDRHDAGMRTLGNLPVPREVVEALPSLIQLQEHLAMMAETQARTSRMWGLAGKKGRGHSDGEASTEGKPAGQADALLFRGASCPVNQAAGQA
jgi:hypothetical protein